LCPLWVGLGVCVSPLPFSLAEVLVAGAKAGLLDGAVFGL
jgi:hypothetical protein